MAERSVAAEAGGLGGGGWDGEGNAGGAVVVAVPLRPALEATSKMLEVRFELACRPELKSTSERLPLSPVTFSERASDLAVEVAETLASASTSTLMSCRPTALMSSTDQDSKPVEFGAVGVAIFLKEVVGLNVIHSPHWGA